MAGKEDQDRRDQSASWEDLLDADSEEEAPKKKPPPKVEPSSPINKLPEKKDESYVPMDDPIQEKRRRQKIVEESDEALMEDLFAGFVKEKSKDSDATPHVSLGDPSNGTNRGIADSTSLLSTDPIDQIQLKSLKHVESFASKLADKICQSPAKSPAWLRLFDLLLKECATKMDLKDLITLQNKVKVAIKNKQEAKRGAEMSKKKPNDPTSSIRNYKDEMDIFYGAGEEDVVSDPDEDYYADFM